MARRPRPWYRKDRSAWFVTIDGQRHNLGPDKKTAYDFFHELMSKPQRRLRVPTMTPPTEDTCLFTSAPLNESTKVEHTIPESLGGRVRSSVVSSTDFNEGWGETLVPALKKPYAMIMNRLGPLLPGIHQSGQLRVDVRGEAPGLALDDEGVLTRQNLDIVARRGQRREPRPGIPL